jgi:hypothetical protein
LLYRDGYQFGGVRGGKQARDAVVSAQNIVVGFGARRRRLAGSASRAAWHHALNQADEHQQYNRSNDGVEDLWYEAGTDVDAHAW